MYVQNVWVERVALLLRLFGDPCSNLGFPQTLYVSAGYYSPCQIRPQPYAFFLNIY